MSYHNHTPQADFENVVQLKFNGYRYYMKLPNFDTDYIQKKIATEGQPYEREMLEDIQARVVPGDLVIDVGAHVGNHTIYLAAVAGCKVEAFEPNHNLCDALNESIRLNNLEEQVHIHNKAIGSSPSYAAFEKLSPENLGSQRLCLGKGDIAVASLDSINFQQPVKVLKIDVEGMEMDVLHGAEKLIDQYRPILYIECVADKNFRAVSRWLDFRKYTYWETFNATPTHLFVPEENVTQTRLIARLQLHMVEEEYRRNKLSLDVRQKLKRAYENERESKEKVLELSLKIAKSQNALYAVTEERNKLKTGLDDLDKKHQKLKTELADLEKEYQKSQSALHAITEDRNKLKTELSDLDMEHQKSQSALHTITEERNNLASKLFAVQEDRNRVQREYQINIKRAEKAEKRLERTKNHLSYQTGEAIVQSTKSFSAALRLPGRIWSIRREAKRRRKEKQDASIKKPNFLKNIFSKLPLCSSLFKIDPKSEEKYVTASILKNNFSKLTELRIACIFDEFTYHSFAPECSFLQLKSDSWRDQVEEFMPDIVFIESAWQGVNDSWYKKVSEVSEELLGLIEWSTSARIPTAFWCKEDPAHFARFLPVARLVDYVFTTDIDCIIKYKDALKHERVYLLPFAAQLAMHNPIETQQRVDAFCFAGSYYPQYPERQKDFSTLVTVGRKLKSVEIYDRNATRPQPHDFNFPPEYHDEMRGALPYTQMDRAYKGYRYGITVNSIKQSQTMFARRAFELMASNTIVVSNFSKGLRMFFGDLVISSDSIVELERRLRPLCEDETLYRRQRLLALRCVLTHHTYKHRLAYIASKASGCNVEVSMPRICMFGEPATDDEKYRLLDAFERQTYHNAELVLIGRPNQSIDSKQRVIWFPDRIALIGHLNSYDYVAPVSAADYYGHDYLMDLVLSTSFANGDAVTKAAYFIANNGGTVRLEGNGLQYQKIDQAALRCSLVRSHVISKLLADTALRLETSAFTSDSLISLDEFSYCRDAGLACSTFDPATVDLAEMPRKGANFVGTILKISETVKAPGNNFIDNNSPLVFSAADWFKLLPNEYDSRLNLTLGENGQILLNSSIGATEHQYIYFKRRFTSSELKLGQESFFQIEAETRLDLRTVFVFYDAADKKIGYVMHTVGARYSLQLPADTASVRLALRIQGAGLATLGKLTLGELRGLPTQVLPTAPNLIVSNQYPSYDDLYRYGFVHSRARAYGRDSVSVEVLRLSSDPKIVFREFENIDVIEADHKRFEQCLSEGKTENVLIHIIDQRMWDIVKEHLNHVQVLIWAHGAEIQPWWRRAMNYGTDALRDQARRTSDVRMNMWREIICLNHPNLHIVFISRKQATEALSDLGINASDAGGVEVIPNFIDSDLFPYFPKDPEQRHRILTIRPFASSVYANDLSIEAILKLACEPFFKDLKFKIVGDGILFEKTVKPINNLPNVDISRAFLTQGQIAALHRDYGVFLVPSRMDSQGVSRDEAMSSGLVPVTTRIAAIPEFVDESCAFLANPENAAGLAGAIRRLHENPALFETMSLAASQRVRRQSGYSQTIGREIEIIKEHSPVNSGGSILKQLAREEDSLTRIAVYGDLNLNIMDGSAIWAASLTETLGGMKGVRVSLLLKSRIHRTHVISRLLDLAPAVQIIEPNVSEKVGLKPAEAVDKLSSLDVHCRFRAFILRGLDLCVEAAHATAIQGRIWAYLTDIPQRADLLDAETHKRISIVIAHSEFILCQTVQMQSYFEKNFSQAVGKTRILPPMIPPVPDRESTHFPIEPFRLCYAGKFAPRWGIYEMFEAFDVLRAQKPTAELHVFGDKVHNSTKQPDFHTNVTQKLSSTKGLTWHGAVDRSELLRQLQTMHACWAFRDPAFEQETHELSTKALEYASIGIPTILVKSPVNVSVFGDDYKLFVESPQEAQQLLLRIASEPDFRSEAAAALGNISLRYTFDSVRLELVAQGLLPEKSIIQNQHSL